MNGVNIQMAYNLAALFSAIFLTALTVWLFGEKKNAGTNS